MKRLVAGLVALGLAAGVAMPARADTGLRCAAPLFSTGFDGVASGGDKAALVEATHAGEPLRVGWSFDIDDDGTGDLIHWADAAFLTVWEGEVFTQVSAIHRQRPRIGQADVILPPGHELWRGLIGSNGTIKGALEGAEPGTGRPVATLWCRNRPAEDRWIVLYRSGAQGEALAGSRAALLSAIRAGQPVRIGWGLARDVDGRQRSVEHVADPHFLTIVDGDHVAAQMPEHLAQSSYWNIDRARFDKGAVMWRGLATTKGSFDAIWVNRATGETVRRAPQRAVFTWYGRGAADSGTASLAIENGVMRDTTGTDNE